MVFWKDNNKSNLKSDSDSPSSSLEPVDSPSHNPSPSIMGGPSSSATSGSSNIAPGAPAYDASSPSANKDDDERYGKVRSALGPGTVIQGKLSFDTPVRIDGKLSGEIFSSKALIVGPQGWIDAQVEVATLVVMGTVKGNVKVTERIELRSGGRLEGDIAAPSFTMAEGAFFNGKCSMAGTVKMTSQSAGATERVAGNPPVDAKESAKSTARENEKGRSGDSPRAETVKSASL